MADVLIRVPLDPETARRLREAAGSQRRSAGDEAAVILTRALTRRERHRPPEAVTSDAGDR